MLRRAATASCHRRPDSIAGEGQEAGSGDGSHEAMPPEPKQVNSAWWSHSGRAVAARYTNRPARPSRANPLEKQQATPTTASPAKVRTRCVEAGRWGSSSMRFARRLHRAAPYGRRCGGATVFRRPVTRPNLNRESRRRVSWRNLPGRPQRASDCNSLARSFPVKECPLRDVCRSRQLLASVRLTQAQAADSLTRSGAGRRKPIAEGEEASPPRCRRNDRGSPRTCTPYGEGSVGGRPQQLRRGGLHWVRNVNAGRGRGGGAAPPPGRRGSRSPPERGAVAEIVGERGMLPKQNLLTRIGFGWPRCARETTGQSPAS